MLTDSTEFYFLFLDDLMGYAKDSEIMSQMLASRIEAILNELHKMNIDEEVCLRSKTEIHDVIDAYLRSTEAYCFKLKNVYEKSFERFENQEVSNYKKPTDISP